jgi:hypothetical protein
MVNQKVTVLEKIEIEELPLHLKLGNRKVLADYYIDTNIENEKYAYKYIVFTRLNAVSKNDNKIKFVNTSFEHCIFDNCYLKNCVFDSCQFIGCKFIGCNFHLCYFTGCDFRFAIFERTQIDSDILDSEAPLEENLKMRFARSLRMNYQQIGDAKAVNKAIKIELNATSEYLYKSWTSSENYYSKKYSGFKRIPQFFEWIGFWIMNFIWGNGESVLKLFQLAFLIILLISFVDTVMYHDANSVKDYYLSFEKSFAIFFGYNIPTSYLEPYIAFIAFTRLTIFSLFTAILVKRFNRR